MADYEKNSVFFLAIDAHVIAYFKFKRRISKDPQKLVNYLTQTYAMCFLTYYLLLL